MSRFSEYAGDNKIVRRYHLRMSAKERLHDVKPLLNIKCYVHPAKQWLLFVIIIFAFSFIQQSDVWQTGRIRLKALALCLTFACECVILIRPKNGRGVKGQAVLCRLRLSYKIKLARRMENA